MPWYTDAAIMLWASAMEIQHDPPRYCQVGAESSNGLAHLALYASKAWYLSELERSHDTFDVVGGAAAV